MIQFGICDDNKIDLTYIHELIQRFSNTYHDEFDYCVARFYDASSLLESVGQPPKTCPQIERES